MDVLGHIKKYSDGYSLRRECATTQEWQWIAIVFGSELKRQRDRDQLEELIRPAFVRSLTTEQKSALLELLQLVDGMKLFAGSERDTMASLQRKPVKLCGCNKTAIVCPQRTLHDNRSILQIIKVWRRLMEGGRINWWLTITANVAVLIGIVLLIVELDQNRDMMRAQTRSELAMGIVGIQSGIAENEQLAAVLAKARDGDTLSPGESLQFANRMLAMFRYWENVHYQYRMGLYDEVEFVRQKDAWEDYINISDAQIDAWCRFRGTFSPEFVQEVDGIVNSGSCQ